MYFTDSYSIARGVHCICLWELLLSNSLTRPKSYNHRIYICATHTVVVPAFLLQNNFQ